jgi:hypothetical protein
MLRMKIRKQEKILLYKDKQRKIIVIKVKEPKKEKLVILLIKFIYGGKCIVGLLMIMDSM